MNNKGKMCYVDEKQLLSNFLVHQNTLMCWLLFDNKFKTINGSLSMSRTVTWYLWSIIHINNLLLSIIISIYKSIIISIINIAL